MATMNIKTGKMTFTAQERTQGDKAHNMRLVTQAIETLQYALTQLERDTPILALQNIGDVRKALGKVIHP